MTAAIVLEAYGERYRVVLDGQPYGDAWPTAIEAWRAALPAMGAEVKATILGHVSQPCRPDVAWQRALRHHGKRALEPSPMRLVTAADVAEAKRAAAEADAEDDRPKIVLAAGELPRVVYDTLSALRDGAEVYRRAGDIVEVVTARRAWQTPESPPALALMSVPATVLSVRAGVTCRFVRTTKNGGEAPTDLPPKLAAVIAAEGARSDHLHVLSGVLEAPALRPDGTVITARGYDPTTGYFLAHEVDLPGFSERPTHEDAKLALAALQDLWSADRDGKKGFAWKGGTADSVVPIAMLLSALARPAICPPKGCVPLFAFSASGKGAGKGTAVDLVFIIATGRSAPAMSWSGDPEEDDKRLGGIALDAPPLVMIDNVPEDVIFQHSRLDACLTLDETAFRILGKTGNPVLPWLTVPSVTGNNLTFGGDLGRRVLISYQCPDVEDPAQIPQNERVHPNIVEHALERREFYLACALTILRAYCVANRPDQGVELGTFTKWAKLVGGALKWAGAANIVDYLAGFDQASEAPTRAAIRTLAAELYRMTSTGYGRAASDLLEDLYPATYCDAKRHNRDVPADPYKDPIRLAVEALCPFRGPPSPDASYRLRFARVLSKHRGQWHAGYQIDVQINPETGKGYDVPRWLARKKAT